MNSEKSGTGESLLSCDETMSVKRELRKEFVLNNLIGTSKEICDIRNKISKIAICDVNVLIYGETGTGKEIAARAVHCLSQRSAKPFIPVNCGAIPENLFENELFGHTKGAYTDAGIQQNGLVKEAEGGTLFLDEIGLISPYIQGKLLRLLQDNEYKPLGESKPRKADVRIIAATNHDLKNLVEVEKFREDLYYRLNIVSLEIPPLRERQEDIPVLVNYFINKYTTEFGKAIGTLSDNCINKLLSHSWPGNIRELENKVQQLIVMAENDTVRTREIEPLKSIKKVEIELNGPFKVCKKKVVESFEKAYLKKLMKKHHGNVVNASMDAGKSRTALWNLLKKYDISATSFKSQQSIAKHSEKKPN